MHFKNVLGIPGSLRPAASSSLLLNHIGDRLLPGTAFKCYGKLTQIPPFDGAEPLPPVVDDFIDEIRNAGLVIFCTPEYAHGVPGALKNALDWTVASDVWIDKPTIVITASSQGEHAHAALMEILKTMSAHLIRESCLLIPFVKAKIDREGNITDPKTAQQLDAALGHVLRLQG